MVVPVYGPFSPGRATELEIQIHADPLTTHLLPGDPYLIVKITTHMDPHHPYMRDRYLNLRYINYIHGPPSPLPGDPYFSLRLTTYTDPHHTPHRGPLPQSYINYIYGRYFEASSRIMEHKLEPEARPFMS